MERPRIKDHVREGRLFTGRALQAGLFVFLALVGLMLRMANLQILNHEHFTTLSRENRVKLLPLPPTRGLIYDRKGRLLAQNLPTFSLEIVPEEVEELKETIDRLADIIEIDADDRERFERLRRQRRRFDSVPIRVRLSEEEVARFAVNGHLFPGVEIRASLMRHYPHGEETAHVIGYVGRISEQELQVIDPSNYSGTTHIGKNGVEKFYEDLLHGTVGVQRVETNALGRVIRVLEEQPPIPGKDLYLSIDLELQRETVAAFGDEIGALVAIDPRNGAVLALVSKPGFDPNLFVDGISRAAYAALQGSPDKPLFNRALRGQYPPGSTVKPFMGLAGLEMGVTNYTERRYCPGFYQLPGQEHRYRDWKKGGHGPTDLKTAVIQSCDVYFYDLAHEMGIDRMHEFLTHFGFGQRTGIDVSGELGGLLPSREWKRDARRAPWYPGETLIMGIGQGYFLTTPLQLASATATISSGGKRFTPRVVEAIMNNGVRPTQPPSPVPVEQLPQLNPRNWLDIADAMAGVVENPRGTARRIRNDKYRIAGKTGTAQVFSVAQDEEYDEDKITKKMRDHALFIAFAPVDDPQIAVGVIVENGGHGGSVAAPIARRVMDRYLLSEVGHAPVQQ